MYNSSAGIKFVQGDSVERTFSLLDENGAAVDPELISAVYFTCRAAWREADVYCSEQGAGTLTFSCEDTPTAALKANVIILKMI